MEWKKQQRIRSKIPRDNLLFKRTPCLASFSHRAESIPEFRAVRLLKWRELGLPAPASSLLFISSPEASIPNMSTSFEAFTELRCDAVSHSHPNPGKAPCSCLAFGGAGQSAQVGRMTASLQQGLAPLVWLVGSPSADRPRPWLQLHP